MATVTPLLRFLRAMTSEQKRELAETCGTTMVYLYQLAAQPWPNPRLRLAKQLVEESKRLRRKLMTEALTYDDLLIGTAAEGELPPARSDA